jgi:hypothetical protein
MGWHTALAGMTVALAAAAGLTGCAEKKPADAAADSSASPSAATSSAGSQTPTDSSSAASPAPTTAPRTETWIALKPGDCLADPPPTDPAVVTVTLVDCSQPHMAEAFLRAPIPVDAALDTTANAECEAGFAQYTGRPSAGGPYIVGYLIDSAQDRTGNIPLPSTVICLLQGAQGQPLTGSAKA